MMWTLLPIELFHSISKDWDLLNKSYVNTPLLQSRFISALLDEFQSGTEIIAICKEGKDIVAIAILFKQRPGFWQTFQPSQAPIGAWLQSPKYELQKLLPSLAKSLPGYCISLGITQQDPDILPRPASTGHISTIDYIETARITITQDFSEFWMSRGKNLRSNVKKQLNRFEREGVDTRLEVVTIPDDISQAVSIYGKIESAGWKSEKGTSVNLNNSQGRFYTNLVSEYCNTLDGAIYQYWYDDEPVATDLCVGEGSVVVILKTTYDESHKKSSPGTLMHHAVFEHIFNENKYKKIEFYGRVMDWHKRWTTEIRVMYHVTYFRWKIIDMIKKII